MKKNFTILILLLSTIVFSQSDQLAQNYFDRGEFDKAIVIYEDLLKAQPNNSLFYQKQILCYQQLKQFEKADVLIQNRIDKTKQANLYVELGYNYQLQKNQDKANKNYQIALDKVAENPNNVYSVAITFEQKSLIEQAIQAYEMAVKTNPSLNFDYQTALLQGQLGKLELMTDKLLDFSFANPTNLPLVQNQLLRFMLEDDIKTITKNFKKEFKDTHYKSWFSG